MEDYIKIVNKNDSDINRKCNDTNTFISLERLSITVGFYLFTEHSITRRLLTYMNLLSTK